LFFSYPNWEECLCPGEKHTHGVGVVLQCPILCLWPASLCLHHGLRLLQKQVVINNAIFTEHIKKPILLPWHTSIVRSDDITWAFNNQKFEPCTKYTLWSECTNIDVKTKGDCGKHVDIFLKLMTFVPFMLQKMMMYQTVLPTACFVTW
jgi:hypothetical protein